LNILIFKNAKKIQINLIPIFHRHVEDKKMGLIFPLLNIHYMPQANYLLLKRNMNGYFILQYRGTKIIIHFFYFDTLT